MTSPFHNIRYRSTPSYNNHPLLKAEADTTSENAEGKSGS